MAKKTKLDKKIEEIQHLDAATQEVIIRLNKSDRRLKIAATSLLVVLLVTTAVGVLYQNHYAHQSNNLIVCITKDLTTPQKSGTQHKYIDYQSLLVGDCRIKFN